MLATHNLTIRFGGHVAVNAVTCSFEPGTLTAIVGPNGAGKTTYFNLISGQLKASSGSVSLGGRDLTGQSVSQRTHAGLGRAFQLTNLFPNLTVLENVRLAVQATQEGKHRRGLNLWSIWSDHRQLTARAEDILRSVAMHERRDTPVASLPHGDQQGHQSIQSSVDGLAAQAPCLVAVVVEIDLERGAVHGDLPLNMALD